MIEVLIDPQPDGDKSHKLAGDIVEARLAGSKPVWGTCARVAVAEWHDENLEMELNQQRSMGDAHPVITYPYRVDEIVDEGTEDERMEKDETRIGRGIQRHAQNQFVGPRGSA